MDIMTKHKQATACIVPVKRTEKTYRIALYQFDPETKQYREVSGIRIEASGDSSHNAIVEQFQGAVMNTFGGG